MPLLLPMCALAPPPPHRPFSLQPHPCCLLHLVLDHEVPL
jgi:hypothetical protein